MSQLTNNTTTLQTILDTINALPEAGGGGGVDTGTIVGVTSLKADPSNVTYYFDLENIPNIDSKRLLVIIGNTQSTEGATVKATYTLTRANAGEAFAMVDSLTYGISGEQNVPSITDYVFTLTNSLFSDVIYYAA